MCYYFCKIFIVKEIYTACLTTNNKIVPRVSLKECLYSSKSEIKVNVNRSRGEKKTTFKNNTATIGELITAEWALVVYKYVYYFMYTDARSAGICCNYTTINDWDFQAAFFLQISLFILPHACYEIRLSLLAYYLIAVIMFGR